VAQGLRPLIAGKAHHHITEQRDLHYLDVDYRNEFLHRRNALIEG